MGKWEKIEREVAALLWERHEAERLAELQRDAFMQAQRVKLFDLRKKTGSRRWRMTSTGEIYLSQAPERELEP